MTKILVRMRSENHRPRRVPLALGVVSLSSLLLSLPAPGRADVLDLAAEPASSFSCKGRSECWGSDDTSAWRATTLGRESPAIDPGDGATLVLRMRLPRPVVVSWKTPAGERVLKRLEGPNGWAVQLYAVPLPPGSRSWVIIRADTQSHALAGKARPVDLEFAEVLRPRHGRCYRDSYWAAKRLLDAVVCVPPAQARLALPPGEWPHLRLTSFSTRAGKLRVHAGKEELAAAAFEGTAQWQEHVAPLPTSGGGPDSLRFTVEGGGDLVAWSPHLIPEKAALPNVLVYLVDTLRANALGSYGGDATASPHFDALAARGVLFERAIAPAPWTLPSVASLFTGRDVRGHGVVHDSDALPRSVATLAEHFRKAGYATAAITGSFYVSDRHGTQRGFRELVDVIPGAGKWGADTGSSSRTATSAALAWLDEHTAEPFFLYVHVMDPHQPYTPPAETMRSFVHVDWPPDDRRWRLAHAPSTGRHPGGRSPLEAMPKGEAEPINSVARALYRAAVASCDGQFGKLLDGLAHHGLTQRTIVALTADHGEELLEHRFTGHGHSLYDEVVRVPLILAYPERLPHGVRVEAAAGLTDVAPTLIRLAGLPVDASMTGIDLSATVTSSAASRERSLFLTRRAPTLPRPKELFSEMDGMVRGRWKLIKNLDDRGRRPTWELYNLGADADEKHNRAEVEIDTLRRLQAELSAAAARRAPAAAASGSVDSTTRERLRALGYEVE